MRLPKLLRHAWTVASKDLLVEFRSRTAILSVAVFRRTGVRGVPIRARPDCGFQR